MKQILGDVFNCENQLCKRLFCVCKMENQPLICEKKWFLYVSEMGII